MSLKTTVYNQDGEKVKEITLSESIFKIVPKNDLVHQAMLAQMGNERQVLAHTKSRAEVRGGGKKPWKQKGTGRARAGSSRSPIWIGGGVTFGPTKNRNFSKNINKKMKQKAMFMVLSDRVKENSMVVLDKIEIKDTKTRVFNEILKNIETKVLSTSSKTSEAVQTKKDATSKAKKSVQKKTNKRSILFINEKSEENIKLSGRNLVGVNVICLDNINILDLLKAKKLIITIDAVKKLEKIYK